MILSSMISFTNQVTTPTCMLWPYSAFVGKARLAVGIWHKLAQHVNASKRSTNRISCVKRLWLNKITGDTIQVGVTNQPARVIKSQVILISKLSLDCDNVLNVLFHCYRYSRIYSAGSLRYSEWEISRVIYCLFLITQILI